MHEGEDFSTKNVLKKHFFIVKMTCPAMVQPANSDYWKLSLSNDLSAINHVSNMYHYRCRLNEKKICATHASLNGVIPRTRNAGYKAKRVSYTFNNKKEAKILC